MHTTEPIPSEEYVQLRLQVRRLLDNGGAIGTILAEPLREQLEAEFMEAWGFTCDCYEAAVELKQLAGMICRGFDHCSFYFEPATYSHIVVTQPYVEAGEVLDTFLSGLTLGARIKPAVIPAPEWGFYYPDRATLVIVKFPQGYHEVLRDLNRLWSPAAQAASGEN